MVPSIVKEQIVLFDQEIGPKQILPFWVTLDQRVIAMKRYSTFS